MTNMGVDKSYKKKWTLEGLNQSKKSIFYELEYWSTLSLKHNLDVMHIEKNVCESLLSIVVGIEGKSKDTDNARCDLQSLKIRSELHLYEEGYNLMKSHANYTLTADDRRKFGHFIKLMNSLMVLPII